jgi:type VI secretion system secreted protein VgrG
MARAPQEQGQHKQTKSVAQLEHKIVKIKGKFGSGKVFVMGARVEEGLSQITSMRVVIAMRDATFTLDKVLGTEVTMTMITLKEDKRPFRGLIVEAEYMGVAQGYDIYALEVRPWLWMLTRASDARIFQNRTVPEIVRTVCEEHGFTNLKLRLSKTYTAREYCVQYHETDFDFISRLMEEEGIFYYFDHSTEVETLVVGDDTAAHDPLKETPELDYMPRNKKGAREEDHIYEWSDVQRVRTGKVSLVDYDLTKPKTNLYVTKALAKGKHSHKDRAFYRMDGHYTTTAAGEDYALVALAAQNHDAERWAGASNVRAMAAGSTFKVKEPKDLPRPEQPGEFLVVQCVHFFRVEVDEGGDELQDVFAHADLDLPPGNDLYQNHFIAAKKTELFRPPQITPWPDMAGLHVAIVTGPSGEEIYTDEYGRIRVQFPWDLDGKNDEKTSCWVRVMTPWAGKNWGAIAIPRIGQEVIIQFERNNPDRPVCMGMLYNAVDMPPYKLPDNMTMTGVKSNSSKGGGGFNEFVMEDKKDAEYVRLQSEKNYTEIIKNNATITIGMEKKDAGDMSLTVYNHLTETLKEGDHTFTVEKGKQTTKVKMDQTNTVTDGNQVNTIEKGNQTETISKGNQAVEITAGNQTIDIKAGKGTTTAAQSFEIVVGQSSIKLEPAKITIKSTEILIESTMNTTVKAGMNLDAKAGLVLSAKGDVSGKYEGGVDVTLKGGALGTVQAGILKIN